MTKLLHVRLLTGAAAGVFAAAALAEPIFTDDFLGKKTVWRIVEKFGPGMRIEFGAKGRNFTGLIVSSDQKDVTDTCWGARTPPISLPENPKKHILVSFDVSPDEDLEPVSDGARYYNAVIWYNAAGRVMQLRSLKFRVKAGDFQTVRQTVPVPQDARSFSIQLGFGAPDLHEGVTVAYKDLRVDMTDSEIVPMRMDRGDFRPPMVRLASPSPTRDCHVRPAFRITDETGVDWASLRIEIDGKDVTAKFERQSEAVVWTGEADWSEGYHPVTVTVADMKGLSYRNRRCFLIGDVPNVPKVTLRDDGITLIDGRPFFPIGIFSVRKLAGHNGNSYERAFDDLKAAGFNTAHAYSVARDPEFLEMARRKGFWLWMNEELPSARFIEKERHYPHVLAWYTGDDTSGHQKPWENDDYDEINRALDPNRITCQADGVRSDAEYSAYHDYVGSTDVFMPEIYPLVRDTSEESRECASRVIRDMQRIATDVRESADGRRHGVWPIIQAFDKGGWKHYPTKQELFAMTFAALCHGATGMIWYEYACQVGVKNVSGGLPKDFSTRWANLCELSGWLNELSPILIEKRTDRDKVNVEICSGAKQDIFGYPSISTWVRHKGDTIYLIAVNSSDTEVDAFFTAECRGAAEVLREARIIPIQNGSFRDVFKPLDVRVYRIGARTIPHTERTGSPLQTGDNCERRCTSSGHAQPLLRRFVFCENGYPSTFRIETKE